MEIPWADNRDSSMQGGVSASLEISPVEGWRLSEGTKIKTERNKTRIWLRLRRGGREERRRRRTRRRTRRQETVGSCR